MIRHWLLILGAIAGFLLYKRYGPSARGLLGVVADDLDQTFFGKTVAIQGPADNYRRFCGVRSKESPIVDCQSLQVTDNHLFDVEKTADCQTRADGKTECQFALKNKLTGLYCSDDGKRFICDRPSVQGWEKHAFIKQPGLRVFSFPGGKSGRDRKACNDRGSAGIVCDGTLPDTYGRNAMFRWFQPSEVADERSLAKAKDDPNSSLFGKFVAITGPASDHRTYCGVKSLADPVLACEDTQVYDNHLFEMVKTQECQPRPEGGQECQFSLKNKLTGGYCADEGDRIICNRASIGDWEKYALIKTPGIREFSFPGAQSGRVRKACSDKVGSVVCQGNPNTYGRNETFRWQLAEEIPTLQAGDIRAPPTTTTDTTTPGESTSDAPSVKPSSATVPSPSSSLPPMVEELNKTFFGQTVVITGPASNHTKYCGVKSMDDPVIECEDSEVFDNHQFEIQRTQECKPRQEGGFECQFSLRNKLTGKFCSDEGGRIVCDRDSAGNAEKHAFIKHPEGRDFSFPGGKSGTARKACSDQGVYIVCNGGKDDYRSANTRFRWKLLSEIPNVQKGDNGPQEMPEEGEGGQEEDLDLESQTPGDEQAEDSAFPTAAAVGPIAAAGAAFLGILILRALVAPASPAPRPV